LGGGDDLDRDLNLAAVFLDRTLDLHGFPTMLIKLFMRTI
jgi:hypothetical protein